MDLELIKKLEDVHFNSQLSLYMSKKISNNYYDIYLSNFIDDHYWNYATNIQFSSINNFNKNWLNLKEIFKTNNRQPVIYLTPTSRLYNDRSNLNLTSLYTDSWLILTNLESYPQYKSELPLVIEEVNSTNIDDFAESVSEGFSSDDPKDPYHGLSDGYRIALKNSINKSNSKYEINHFMVKYNQEVIGTITVNNDKEIACLYNITTKKEYQQKGICKELMSYIVNYLYHKNIKIVCLQTEVGFYTEQVYLKLGFKKIFEGYGYGEE